jgi:GAF domain-containing protein
MMGVGCFLGTLSKLGAGDQLEDVLDDANKNLAFARRTREFSFHTMTVVRQATACLAGQTRSPTSLSDDALDEEGYIGSLDSVEHGNSLFHYSVLKQQIHYIFGEHEAALAAGDAAEPRAIFCAGTPYTKIISFYRCLVILALPSAAEPEEAARRSALLEGHKGQLDALSASCPKGYLHMKVLVDAELARAAGKVEEAIGLFERAIELSHEHKAPHIEAIACELCAKFYMGRGALRAAAGYMRDAFRAYLHWGAAAKAEAIEAQYGPMLPTLSREITRARKRASSVSTSISTTSTSDLTNTSSTILSRTTLGSLRDASLVLRAAQAIAGEIDLPKVIARLAELVLENAGAQRGALILSRDGELVVSARFGEASGAVEEGQGRPLGESDSVAQGVVLYVARTQESVVLDDTTTLSRFSEDPYIRSGEAKSLLCLPLMHQSRLSGVLYLENRSTSGVFNAARVELLALLSSQAAIAIENARLISNVRAANLEVKRANERLEVEVAHRTEELVGAKERLERELARREQIEEERAALQEKIIAAQRDRLAEMSTPVIPITDEIIVMPLIGTVDRERASQVLAAALEGAQRHRARVLILDITGIKQIDANVAGTLLGVANALRLLGAECVLTGIAPSIATTLVTLGVDLVSCVTMGTLQSGMDYALRRVRGVGLARARTER